MSVKRQSVSPPVRRKDGRGRPSTPFLRERILQSAAELFADREFDLVLIDEVAAHAGVGKGSVYRQFKSKEELYAAVVIDGFTELQREIRSALAGCTSMRDQTTTIIRHTLKFFWTRRQFFALLRDPQGTAAIAGASVPRSAQRFVAPGKRRIRRCRQARRDQARFRLSHRRRIAPRHDARHQPLWPRVHYP